MIRWLAAALSAALVIPASVAAPRYTPPVQENFSVGQKVLISLLREAAAGRCSAQMTPLLRVQCEQQLGTLQPRLQYLGNIVSTRYQGAQPVQGGYAHVYVVYFQRGTMTWMIGVNPDGSVPIFWSPG